MWDCGSPPESAGRTSHEPTVQKENSRSFVDVTVTTSAEEGLWKSSYLAAGQVQGSVPVLVQQCQVSLGPVKEDGWMTQRCSFIPLNTGFCSHAPTFLGQRRRGTGLGTHLRCHCVPYQQRPSGQNVHFCPPC